MRNGLARGWSGAVLTGVRGLGGCPFGCPHFGTIVGRYTGVRGRSWRMQPLGDRTVTLVERRRVDLVRVASAICRCV
ncbi:putative leader peptide [Streptomyces sp. NPDC048479]|uniref:putative leader peptide n=1 Tax=Streptomyces sp. NPDC048479 TaxID=3154725 RepID=UPI00342E2C5F